MLNPIRRIAVSLCLLAALTVRAEANPPVASYIYPAGGQRGTTVKIRVGGLFLHEKCGFTLGGKGLTASPELLRTPRIWFEGPVLPLPESQQQEDYPADLLGTVAIAKDAALGSCRARVFTAQGGASGPLFVVGDLPEVIEREIDGEPIAERLTLPITANGRIFPREDIDLWEFEAEAGKTVTVLASARLLNSPLVPRLDILDANGRVIAEEMTHPCPGSDSSLKFTPTASGKYRVRIVDSRTLGGPAYVYRLTITTAPVPEYHFPLQVPSDGLKEITEPATVVPVPAALNGRIASAGQVNEWKVELKKAARYTIELQAARFGSPLFGVVTVHDSMGKELERREANGTGDPAAIAFTPSADGTYLLRVAEKFRGRGGPNFVYRLRVLDAAAAPNEAPGFRLTIPTDIVALPRAGTLKVVVGVQRVGGFGGSVLVSAADLPKGITAAPLTIAANQTSGELTLTANAEAIVAVVPLRINGVAVVGLGRLLHSEPAMCLRPGMVNPEPDVQLAITFPTPFKLIDEYVMTSAPRGEIYRRKYRIERNGFNGPITVQLADKQARHLQGVTGPVIVIPPGQNEFDYPITLPPWMELGRTCRVCVMAVAQVKDPVDGREHTVSFSSVEQNQQMIVVVGPGRLDLSIGKVSVRADAGEVTVPVAVARGKDLAVPVTVEVLIPEHLKGVTAEKVVISPGERTGVVVVKFTADAGPFTLPLTFRATAADKSTPVTAEAKLEVVK